MCRGQAARAKTTASWRVVRSAAKEERSRLMVLDAANLALLSTCELDLSLPLGFHGSFALAPS